MPTQNTNPEDQKVVDDQKAVLDAIFGSQSDAAFDDDDGWEEDTGDTSEQQQSLPETQAQEQETVQEQHTDNDAVRYQYWQAEAQKKENELAKMRAETEYYKRLAELQEQGSEPEPQDAKPARFPDPPSAPKAPIGYSPEEALSNPQSPSAQYVADYQQWQQNMFEYSNLKTQYLEAVLEEKFQELEQEKAQAREDYERKRQYDAQISSVRSEVMQKFGVDERVADDFISKMNDPQSLTIENLYALYNAVYNKGAQATKKPTDTFQQSKVANQFGPAFNNLPPGISTTGKSQEDQIFDALVEMDTKGRDW
jgi:hypothetical protein